MQINGRQAIIPKIKSLPCSAWYAVNFHITRNPAIGMNGENAEFRNDNSLTNLLIIYLYEKYTKYALQQAEPEHNIGAISIKP